MHLLLLFSFRFLFLDTRLLASIALLLTIQHHASISSSKTSSIAFRTFCEHQLAWIGSMATTQLTEAGISFSASSWVTRNCPKHEGAILRSRALTFGIPNPYLWKEKIKIDLTGRTPATQLLLEMETALKLRQEGRTWKIA
jgi:hypothetical protein